MSFPIEIWYEKLRAIARSEVNRLIYAYSVPNLDHDDAKQHAVIEAWLAIEEEHKSNAPRLSWGFVRIVMRRALINEFVAPYKLKKNTAELVPVLLIDEFGNEYPNPELVESPWRDSEDQIAMSQLTARIFVRKHNRSKVPDRKAAREFADNIREQTLGGNRDRRSRKTSREWDRVQRVKFIAKAKRLMHRRFD